MRDLTERITVLAPDAADALKAIAYFDELLQHGASVRSIVRAAVALSGVPANLIDRAGTESVRVTVDGSATPVADHVDEAWPRARTHDGALEILLERTTPSEVSLDVLVAERALLAAATTIGHVTDPRLRDESVAIRTAVDQRAAEQLRHQALGRLGLTPQTMVRVIAVRGKAPMIARTLEEAHARAASLRAGIGFLVPSGQAPTSWRSAWSALVLTAESTREDPGDRIVTADDAGSLLWIAEQAVRSAAVNDDIRAISAYAASVPWLLETIHALSITDSIRDAATELGLHHSTVQERKTRASSLLGWDVTDQRGKLRTQLALVMRRVGNAQGGDRAPGEPDITGSS